MGSCVKAYAATTNKRGAPSAGTPTFTRLIMLAHHESGPAIMAGPETTVGV